MITQQNFVFHNEVQHYEFNQTFLCISTNEIKNISISNFKNFQITAFALH
jgi:hypothetical protein